MILEKIGSGGMFTPTYRGGRRRTQPLDQSHSVARISRFWILSRQAAVTLGVLVSRALYQIYTLTAVLIALRRET